MEAANGARLGIERPRRRATGLPRPWEADTRRCGRAVAEQAAPQWAKRTRKMVPFRQEDCPFGDRDDLDGLRIDSVGGSHHELQPSTRKIGRTGLLVGEVGITCSETGDRTRVCKYGSLDGRVHERGGQGAMVAVEQAVGSLQEPGADAGGGLLHLGEDIGESVELLAPSCPGLKLKATINQLAWQDLEHGI